YPFIQTPSNFLTVLFTMLWLFWFGVLFQEYQGGKRLWALFISGSLVGSIAYLVSLNSFPVFAGTHHLLMGASTGVSTIIIATATLIPHYRIHIIFLGPIKLLWVAIVTVLLDIVLIQIGDSASRIAQLGGAFWGFVYMKQFQQGRDLLYPFLWIGEQIESILQVKPKTKLKIISNRLTHSAPNKNQKPNQAEIDRILDKINKVGYEKLTKEEKQTLFNASNE
ncbi:MAG: rhomboid family intramembrane serine protease, partial [Bacteroidia bacterium]|nr:rhomboid family intramembrane serine protease [Bacteroidia bacterium]